MIRLSNGHEFEFVTASGAAGWNGQYWAFERPFVWMRWIDPSLFTHITKTVTRSPVTGNLRWTHPWSCIKLIRNGTVNAIGLSNPGFIHWLTNYAPMLLQEQRANIIVSIATFEEGVRELQCMASLLSYCNVCGIEYNASCPNRATTVENNPDIIARHCAAIKEKAPDLPLILKLSVASRAKEVIPCVRGMVEAIDINSVPWHIAFPNTVSPLARFGGGGVSGMIAQKHTWPFAKQVEELSDIPVIWPSIWSYEDLVSLRSKDAPNRGFSFGAIHIPRPSRPLAFLRPTAIVRRIKQDKK